MAQSIAERVEATGGRTSGFDYLRIGLAVSILLWHGISTSYGQTYELIFWRGPLGWLMHAVLPMFFALSGFLVTGSLERCPTLVSYFGLRVLRIVPALAVEVLISALIFGPLLSSHGPVEYFSSPQLHAYFLNIVGDVHFVLPGVFEHNPVPHTVNAQLWTIPFELQCYAALGALALAGAVKWPRLLLLVAVLGQALWAWEAIRRGDNGGSGGPSGTVLVVSFLAGMVFHVYRTRIKLSIWIFLPCLALTLALSMLPRGAYYLPFPVTYLTVYLGLLNPPRLPYIFSGDYSYGIYLYGYPIQQAFASSGPWAHSWCLNALVCVPACVLVAVCSWHFVEKPTLRLRRHMSVIEAKVMSVLVSVRDGVDRTQLWPQPARFRGSGGLDDTLLATDVGLDVIDGFWKAVIFAAGLAGVLLLVNATEKLGLICIGACFLLRVIQLHHLSMRRVTTGSV